MKLKELKLNNYRRFEKLEIDFHPDLTVIIARNGQGKTTVLEAIAAALGPYVGAFDHSKAKHIERSDARYACVGDGWENEQHFPVRIQAALLTPGLQWERALNGTKNRTTTKEAAPLVEYGKQLQSALKQDHQTLLPIVRYYSSKRLWVNVKNTSTKAILTESRQAAYEDCLSASSSYTQLQYWMRQATYAQLQQKQQAGYERSNLGVRIQGIAAAVDKVLAAEGWSGFHYSTSLEELAMAHTDHGALPISLLSDGVRAMISLVADLALRCARLNSFLGADAASQTPGIVLIDEVDLHLHPAWQQRVLSTLQQAFPRIQFIVSTHSPQVLSTVSSQQIRLLLKDSEEQWHAIRPDEEVKGLESAVALNDIMGVNPIPQVQEAQWLEEYIAHIENGSHESKEAQALRQDLLRFYGNNHDVIRDADRLIRFQAFKLRQQDKKGSV